MTTIVLNYQIKETVNDKKTRLKPGFFIIYYVKSPRMSESNPKFSGSIYITQTMMINIIL